MPFKDLMLLPFILSLSELALWQSVVLCLCDVHERTWNSDISWSGYLDAKYYLHEFQMLWIFFSFPGQNVPALLVWVFVPSA